MSKPTASYDEKLFAATIACLGFVYAKADYDSKPGELVDVAVELARETLAELGYSRGHS
jgi:hypothetical protein